MRVMLDLDGVVYDFAASLRRTLEWAGWPHPMPAPVRWEFFEDWGMSAEDFRKWANGGVNCGFIFTGPAHPLAGESVRALANAGHEIHIITDRNFGRPGLAKCATEDWLAQHGIPYHSLTFSADKTCVPTDIAIDDKPENVAALRAAGTMAFMQHRPWNAGADVPTRLRVGSIAEFAYTVTGKWPRHGQ